VTVVELRTALAQLLAAQLGTYRSVANPLISTPAIWVVPPSPDYGKWSATGLEAIIHATPESQPEPLTSNLVLDDRRWRVVLIQRDTAKSAAAALELVIARFPLSLVTVVPALSLDSGETYEQVTIRITDRVAYQKLF